MGMRLRVFLLPEEDRTLRELRRATTVLHRGKDRADVACMNARGNYVETIAADFNRHVETVRKTLERLQTSGFDSVWEGSPCDWQEV